MKRRLDKELEEINTNPLGFIVEQNEQDLLNWVAVIEGPADSPYEGSQFRVNIIFPDNYPFKAPGFQFITPILHPNIGEKGEVCQDLISARDWKPTNYTRQVLEKIVIMLHTQKPYRIEKELKEIITDPLPGVTIELNDQDALNWVALISGPADSPYAGGQFRVNIRFPDNYPFKAPHFQFITPIFHPHIGEKGELCQVMIGTKDWQPTKTTRQVIELIVNMLNTPNLDRIEKELKEIITDPLPGVTIELNEMDPTNWVAWICGPVDSPYEGGQFKVDIKFPYNYPQKAPEMGFVTPIFHPNILECRFCYHSALWEWRPTKTIRIALQHIIHLLKNLNPLCNWHAFNEAVQLEIALHAL